MSELDVWWRACAWCGGAIDAGVRADAVCCSTSCRQARHRATRVASRVRFGGVELEPTAGGWKVRTIDGGTLGRGAAARLAAFLLSGQP